MIASAIREDSQTMALEMKDMGLSELMLLSSIGDFIGNTKYTKFFSFESILRILN